MLPMWIGVYLTWGGITCRWKPKATTWRSFDPYLKDFSETHPKVSFVVILFPNNDDNVFEKQ